MIVKYECSECLGKNDYPCTLSFQVFGNSVTEDLKNCPFKKGKYHSNPKWRLKGEKSVTGLRDACRNSSERP